MSATTRHRAAVIDRLLEEHHLEWDDITCISLYGDCVTVQTSRPIPGIDYATSIYEGNTHYRATACREDLTIVLTSVTGGTDAPA